MKILVAWDDPAEAELLHLYLSSADHQTTLCHTAEDLLGQVRREGWEVVLLALTFPATPEEGFASFRQVQEALPGVPVVLAYRPPEMIQLPRFLKHGLRFHLVRDNQNDFVFLVLAALDLAVAVRHAEEAQRLYGRLVDYLRE